VCHVVRTSSDRPWGPPSLPYSGYRVSFSRVKWPGRGVDHPLPSRAEVKERRAKPLLPLWAFMAFPRVNCTFVCQEVMDCISSTLYACAFKGSLASTDICTYLKFRGSCKIKVFNKHNRQDFTTWDNTNTLCSSTHAMC
jgi:hypothetical protein